MTRKKARRKFDNRIRRILRLKPVLPYLEMHLTDHCNLNCKGCTHFSPIADRLFANINEFKSDVQQLSRLFSNIKAIRLLGGEPLLHPKIADFISYTRALFPNSKIHIVSNGILLPTMNQEFWESCRQNSASIHLTIYPPFLGEEPTWIKLAKSNRVIIKSSKASNFFAMINSKGNAEVQKGTKQCVFPFSAMVRQGKFYSCWVPALVHYFNQQYGSAIPNKDYINIKDPMITGWDLLTESERSTITCKYCTFCWKNTPNFPWAKSTRDRSDWDVCQHEQTIINDI